MLKKEKRNKTIKIIIFIITIMILIGCTIYLYPIMKELLKPEGRENLKIEIQQNGPNGILLLLGLEAAQIFLPILPGEPIEILAGMCYGTFGGLIFIMLSVFIVTAMIFFMVRKFGRDFVYTMVSKEKIQKIENSKLFTHPKQIEYIMLILFLLPGTPKDLLTYLAGLLPIKPSRFIVIATLARLPSIISSTYAGATLINGNWKIGLLMYVGIFVVVGIAILLAKKFDNTEITKEIEEKINTDYIYVSTSNEIESPNDHVLFSTNENNTIKVRNVKNNNEKSISLFEIIRHLPAIKKVQNIPYISEELLKVMYSGIYQTNDISLFDKVTNNPSSGGNPSSGSMSSRFI